eukprot:scaffold1182_cov124-Isochrysis_galbana.AAC.13
MAHRQSKFSATPRSRAPSASSTPGSPHPPSGLSSGSGRDTTEQLGLRVTAAGETSQADDHLLDSPAEFNVQACTVYRAPCVSGPSRSAVSLVVDSAAMSSLSAEAAVAIAPGGGSGSVPHVRVVGRRIEPTKQGELGAGGRLDPHGRWWRRCRERACLQARCGSWRLAQPQHIYALGSSREAILFKSGDRLSERTARRLRHGGSVRLYVNPRHKPLCMASGEHHRRDKRRTPHADGEAGGRGRDDGEGGQFARLEPVAREGGDQIAIAGCDAGIDSRFEDVLHRSPAMSFQELRQQAVTNFARERFRARGVAERHRVPVGDAVELGAAETEADEATRVCVDE